ncbi:MAG: EscE/YscE/SsaE family type III secretion system needle protein co-chaperone [Acetobacteraceae bacterium]
MSETTALFDIQDRLAADKDGSARRSLEAELATLRQTLKRRLDAGAPPDEFRKLTTLLDAATAAGEVVANTWKMYHIREGA